MIHHHFISLDGNSYSDDLHYVEHNYNSWESIWYNYPDPNFSDSLYPITILHSGSSYWLSNKSENRAACEMFGIELIVAGSMFFKQGNSKEVLLKKNTIFILRKGVDNYYRTGPDGFCLKRFVRIEGNILDRILASCGLDNVNFIPTKNKLHLSKIFKEITLLMQKDSDDAKHEIALLAYKILLDISREYYKDTHGKSMQKVVKYMQDNIEKSLSAQILANFVGMSVTKFYRKFHSEFGVSPIAYFINLKVDRACYLLSNTNLLVKEISYNLNFKDCAYFSRVFKKKVGMTPGAFKEMVIEESSM